MVVFSLSVFADGAKGETGSEGELLEKKTDAFLEMDTKIEKFAEKIIASKKSEGCENISAKKPQEEWNTNRTLLLNLHEDMQESMHSSCSRKIFLRIDQDIQNKILVPFETSGLACDDFSLHRSEFNELIQMRTDLVSQDLPAEIEKEQCANDSRKKSFEQSAEAWEELKSRWTELQKFFDEEKKGDNTEGTKEREAAEKTRSDKINARAQEKADAMVEGFIENSILSPLYDERSQIESRLKRLPSGKSVMVRSTTVSAFDMLTPRGMNNPFSEEYRKKVEEELAKIGEKNTTNIRNSTLFAESIDHRKNFVKEVSELSEKLRAESIAMSNSQEFSQPLSEAVIFSLQPFHITLQETETSLLMNTKALESVLNRQNIEVTGR